MLKRALTSCNVARRARFLILSFIETKNKVKRIEKLIDFLGIKVVIMAKIAL